MQRLPALVAIALCLLATAGPAPAGEDIITTVIGSYTGDGAPAVLAQLNGPGDVARDVDGNLYVSEEMSNRVRKIAPDGTITAFAGSGAWGTAGDGGPATAAELQGPIALATDTFGNVYILDGAAQIRRVAADGTISTVAGGGDSFAEDVLATDATVFTYAIATDPEGRVHFSDLYRKGIFRVEADGSMTRVAGALVSPLPPGEIGDGVPALEARLGTVLGLAITAGGDLYIADAGSNRVRKVTRSSGLIMTVAGTGAQGAPSEGPALASNFQIIVALALDAADSTLYVADAGARQVFALELATGELAKSAGRAPGAYGFAGDGGLAADALFALRQLMGMTVRADGSLVVADGNNHRLREVDPDGIINTVAGRDGSFGDGGPAREAGVEGPGDVVVDGEGNLYFSEPRSHRVRRISRDGTVTTIAGTGSFGHAGDGGPALAAKLATPDALALDGAGALYIAELGGGWDNADPDVEQFTGFIRRLDLATGIIETVAGSGVYGGIDADAAGLATSIIVHPMSIAVDGTTSLYIGSRYQIVRKVDLASGTLVRWAGGSWDAGEPGEGAPATEGRFGQIQGLAIDASGDLLVADWESCRLRRVRTADATLWTVAGKGCDYAAMEADIPDGSLAFDTFIGGVGRLAVGADGSIYSTLDYYRSTVKRIAPDGTIWHVAGSFARYGHAGDGGPAAIAQIVDTTSVALGPAGELYVGDSGARQIRKVFAEAIFADGFDGTKH